MIFALLILAMKPFSNVNIPLLTVTAILLVHSAHAIQTLAFAYIPISFAMIMMLALLTLVILAVDVFILPLFATMIMLVQMIAAIPPLDVPTPTLYVLMMINVL